MEPVQAIQLKNRLEEIDGLRGWAALVVLFFHLSVEIFGELVPIIRSPFWHFFLDGHLAVYIFFLLSGDALSCTFTPKINKGLSANIVVKRYFRLVGPIFFSCLTTYILMRLNWTFHTKAGVIVKNYEWLGTYLPFEPSWIDMLKYSLIDIFIAHDPNTSYNNFLWPMGIELVGSMIVFSIGSVFSKLKHPIKLLFWVSVLLTLAGTYYALFFIGILFGILRDEGYFARVQKQNWNWIFTIIGSLLVVSLDGLLEFHNLKSRSLMIVISTMVVFVSYSSNFLLRFFKNPFSRFLGSISFPLYVMHFSIIISFTSWLIVKNQDLLLVYQWPTIMIILASVLFAILVAYIVRNLESKYLEKLNLFTQKLIKP